jgi:hypothetical protein
VSAIVAPANALQWLKLHPVFGVAVILRGAPEITALVPAAGVVVPAQTG